MSQKVVIVGGGIIGLCTAYYAARRGFTVSLIDRGTPVEERCSAGNAGMIVPSHFVPLAAPGMVAMGAKMMLNPESPFRISLRPNRELADWAIKFMQSATKENVNRASPILRDLNLRSRSLYEEMHVDSDGAFGLKKRGLLMLCKSPETLREETHLAERATALGVSAQVLDSAETAKLDPNIQMNVAGSVYFPKDCHLNPNSLLAWLTQELNRMNVEIRWSTEVTGWRRTEGKLTAVVTSKGEVAGDQFVLAGGAWTAETAKSLQMKMPMQAGKGYSFNVTRPAALPDICSILTEARVAVTPMDGSLRFAGTMEITGLDLSIDNRRVEGIRKSIPDYFPQFNVSDFRGLPVWSGLRPCSPDGMPYLGRTGKLSNLIIAAGHAMMGLSLGPVTGTIVADLLEENKPEIDLGLLKPERFA